MRVRNLLLAAAAILGLAAFVPPVRADWYGHGGPPPPGWYGRPPGPPPTGWYGGPPRHWGGQWAPPYYRQPYGYPRYGYGYDGYRPPPPRPPFYLGRPPVINRPPPVFVPPPGVYFGH